MVRRFTEVVDPVDTLTSWWVKLYVDDDWGFRKEWERVFGVFDKKFLSDLGVIIEYIIKSDLYRFFGDYDEELVGALKEYDGAVLMVDEFTRDLEENIYESPGGNVYVDLQMISWILGDVASVVRKYFDVIEGEDRKKLMKLLS